MLRFQFLRIIDELVKVQNFAFYALVIEHFHHLMEFILSVFGIHSCDLWITFNKRINSNPMATTHNYVEFSVHKNQTHSIEHIRISGNPRYCQSKPSCAHFICSLFSCTLIHIYVLLVAASSQCTFV